MDLSTPRILFFDDQQQSVNKELMSIPLRNLTFVLEETRRRSAGVFQLDPYHSAIGLIVRRIV
jgi:hypothetical protein